MAHVPSVRQACSICGDDSHRIDKMRKVGNRWLCPYDARGMHDMPAEAATIIRSPKSRKDVRTAQVVPLYAKTEAHVFNFLAADFNGGVVPSARYVNKGAATDGGELALDVPFAVPQTWATAVSALYLANVITEDSRPKNWIDRAKVKLRELVDRLLEQQAGPDMHASLKTAIGRTSADTDLEYGGILTVDVAITGQPDVVLADTYPTTQAGFAFLRAFQVLGDPKYQAAYRRVLLLVRRLQCCGWWNATNRYRITAMDAGARAEPGGLPDFLAICGGSAARPWTGQFGWSWNPANTNALILIRDISALELLKAALDLEGDTTYGHTAAYGPMSRAYSATLSEMIEVTRAFWTDGVPEVGGSTVITGFSSTTPKLYYHPLWRSHLPTFEGYGVWTLDSYVYEGSTYEYMGSHSMAAALRGWYSAFGYDAKAAEIYTWLMSGTSNVFWLTPAGATQDEIYNGAVFGGYWSGDYNPKLGLTSDIGLSIDGVGVMQNDSNYYDLATLGLLAPIHSARDPAGFALGKNTWSRAYRWAYSGRQSNDWVNPGTKGLAGLTQQINGFTWGDAFKAALFADVYRHEPLITVQRDHPEST